MHLLVWCGSEVDSFACDRNLIGGIESRARTLKDIKGMRVSGWFEGRSIQIVRGLIRYIARWL